MFRRSVWRWCAAAGAGGMKPSGEQQPTTEKAQTASDESKGKAATGTADEMPASWDEVPGARRRFNVAGGDGGRKRSYEGGNAFFTGFLSVSIISLGCSFIFVPLYRMYCTPTARGFDPKFLATKTREQIEEDEKAHPILKKLLSVRFLSDVGNTMPVAFVPLQKKLDVLIGEPALAFYSAYNKSDRTLIGVSSYTISPPEAMAYLNKIQCFCFEEQRFKPHELVEMPVFFYIDRDFLNDPMINWLDEVIINYTFFNLERTRDIIQRM